MIWQGSNDPSTLIISEHIISRLIAALRTVCFVRSLRTRHPYTSSCIDGDLRSAINSSECWLQSRPPLPSSRRAHRVLLSPFSLSSSLPLSSRFRIASAIQLERQRLRDVHVDRVPNFPAASERAAESEREIKRGRDRVRGETVAEGDGTNERAISRIECIEKYLTFFLSLYKIGGE